MNIESNLIQFVFANCYMHSEMCVTFLMFILSSGF